MISKKHSDEGGFVYSTNPDFNKNKSTEKESPVSSGSQDLRVWFEKRNGKPSTIIRGFKGPVSELKELGKTIRQKCSVGGAEKDGEIILQGDVRAKVMEILKAQGFKAKNAGG